jgi:hypothetical protein
MVEIIMDDGKNILVLDTLGPGSNLGAYGFLLEENYNYSARACMKSGTIIIKISSETIKEIR